MKRFLRTGLAAAAIVLAAVSGHPRLIARSRRRADLHQGRRADPLQIVRDCHRPGEVAPMSLISYDEVRPWAKAIKQKVVSRARCRRGYADPQFSELKFRNDRTLTQTGNRHDRRLGGRTARRRATTATCRRLPEFGDGWKFGEPDYIVEDAEGLRAAGRRRDRLPELLRPGRRSIRTCSSRRSRCGRATRRSCTTRPGGR